MRSLILAALLGSALALAACGGDDGEGRSSAAAYRAELTQLCTAFQQQAAQIGGVQGANAAALAEYFDKVAAVQVKRRMQFERLRPPAEVQDEHARIAALFVQEIAAIQQAATSFRAGSDAGSTYETFKASENEVLREQATLLEKLKVAGCQSDVDSGAGSAPGSR